ncbi:hypothetical protein NHF50_11295 [Flavobacterium sp. NRK F10]|uniref:hypothetical protein n=1 Tax=Flavobacterium sp. NRK F10 TaxID=2954931 RepID=UPI002090522F|nr:hypothetical protein [Flavobacterium sp. NRK F10]MCO6175627.1 hypothetical protein [Flavobacterium sp. NRK F10]
MLKSAEVRWLLNKGQEKQIEHWFATYDQQFGLEDNYPRYDYYLSLPDIDSLGIKIRDPREMKEGLVSHVEIKKQIEENKTFKFNEHIEGQLNTWIKYSIKLVDAPLIVEILNSGNATTGWIPVAKDRLILKYDLNTRKLVSATTFVDEGCGIELTRFKLKEKSIYTFGFEAFSKSDQEKRNLFRTLPLIFESVGKIELNKKNSKSYPEILQQY